MNKLIIIVLLSCCSSCATVSIKTPTMELSYTRFWDQELHGISLYSDGNGTIRGGVEAQKSTEQLLAQILNTMIGSK